MDENHLSRMNATEVYFNPSIYSAFQTELYQKYQKLHHFKFRTSSSKTTFPFSLNNLPLIIFNIVLPEACAL